MVDRDEPAAGERSSGRCGKRAGSTGPVSSVTGSRRRLLATIAAGGASVLAGCGKFGSALPVGPGDAGGGSTGGYPFRAPIGDDPAKTTFLARHDLRPRSLYGWANASIHLQRFLFETGIWTNAIWPRPDAQVHYTWIEEPIEITPTEITITIRDDAYWSDGEPITAADIACIPLSNTIRSNRRPYYADEEQDRPANIYHAIDGFDVSKRTVTYRNSQGHFDTFWELSIRNRLGTFYGPHLIPTHLAPYEKYAKAVMITARRAQQGKIDPWKRDPEDPHKRALIDRYLRDIEHAKAFSKPENVVSTGAWDLVELRGSRAFVFEPNEHHRNADAINFDRFVLEYTPSVNRMNAAITADRFDYASTHWERVGGVTPESVVESFPDHITELRIPGGIYTGNELGVNFHHPALGKRPVRQAIMYALDHEAIAQNLHPTATVPVETPGGDCWDATNYVGSGWIDERLTTYTADRDRAAELMREAGYSRIGGQWYDKVGEGADDGIGGGTGNNDSGKSDTGTGTGTGNGGGDGEALGLTIATPSRTPRWEPTVASQLSDFGIETSVTTVGRATYSSRLESGEFPLWVTGLNSLTNKAPATLFVWHTAVENHHQYGIFQDEQYETGRVSDNGVPLPHTADRFRVFTIRAPPVGEPTGALKEYPAASLSLSLQRTGLEEYRHRVKVGIWLANWYLPTIPIMKKIEQHFIDDAHWTWPKDTASWSSFTSNDPRVSSGLLASGRLRADPDNPEAGGSST